MSAPSDNMPIPAQAIHSKPLLVRHLPYFIGAAILVVLGLCGQINLAQAAFFGFGA